jgi:hypothetical protein
MRYHFMFFVSSQYPSHHAHTYTHIQCLSYTLIHTHTHTQDASDPGSGGTGATSTPKKPKKKKQVRECVRACVCSVCVCMYVYVCVCMGIGECMCKCMYACLYQYTTHPLTRAQVKFNYAAASAGAQLLAHSANVKKASSVLSSSPDTYMIGECLFVCLCVCVCLCGGWSMITRIYLHLSKINEMNTF